MFFVFQSIIGNELSNASLAQLYRSILITVRGLQVQGLQSVLILALSQEYKLAATADQEDKLTHLKKSNKINK